jgi:hypothetical protein
MESAICNPPPETSTRLRLIHALSKLINNPIKTHFGDGPNSIHFYPDKPIILINRSVIPWILTSLFDSLSLLEFDPCEPHFSLQLSLDCRLLMALVETKCSEGCSPLWWWFLSPTVIRRSIVSEHPMVSPCQIFCSYEIGRDLSAIHERCSCLPRRLDWDGQTSLPIKRSVSGCTSQLDPLSLTIAQPFAGGARDSAAGAGSWGRLKRTRKVKLALWQGEDCGKPAMSW